MHLHTENIEDHSIADARDDHKANIENTEQIVEIWSRGPELPPIRTYVDIGRSIPTIELLFIAPGRLMTGVIQESWVRRSVQHLPTVLKC